MRASAPPPKNTCAKSWISWGIAPIASRRACRVDYTCALAASCSLSLTHAFADRYFGELISGICDRARKLKYKVVLEQVTPEFIAEREHLDLFERRFVDGVLCCLGNSDQHPFLTDFPAGSHPMIVVNNYFPQWDLDHIVCDYRAGAEQAMNYLLQLNHRRIGMIAGSSRVQTARDVVDVYKQKAPRGGVLSHRRNGIRTAYSPKPAEQRPSRNYSPPILVSPRSWQAMTRWPSALCTICTASAKTFPPTFQSSASTICRKREFIDPTLSNRAPPLYQAEAPLRAKN